MNVNLRLIETKDLSAIIDLRASTRENRISRNELRKRGITEESTTELLRTTHRGWLCEAEGKVLGFAIGDGKTGELWVIAVLPDFEGKGIGVRLIKMVEEWLWSLGWQEIWLWTSSDPNTRANQYYLKQGWHVTETKDHILYLRKKRPNQARGRISALGSGRASATTPHKSGRARALHAPSAAASKGLAAV